MRKLLIVALLLTGCAARRGRTMPVVVVPRECITKVELTPDTECYENDKGDLTICRHVNITRMERCEVLKVPKQEDKK